MRCCRCGKKTYVLQAGDLCNDCFKSNPVTGRERLRRKLKEIKKPRKPKSKHNVENNILTYLLFVVENPSVNKINKIDFEKEMDIPITSVNYLITVLKKRGYIKTAGIVGKQWYEPIRTFRDCILARVENIRELVK